MATKTGFTPLLCEYLNSMDLDGDVYGEYIASNLQDLKESSEEERMEAVMEFISGALDDSNDRSTEVCRNILSQWDTHNPKSKTAKPKKQKKHLTVEEQVQKVINSTAQMTASDRPPSSGSSVATTSSKKYPPTLSASEKQKMLRQYGYASDEDETVESQTDHSNEATGSGSGAFGLNSNKLMVSQLEKEKREELKQSHVEKLERDKQSRDLQKQRKEQRKEKEKHRTQKQERRRC